MAAAVDPKIGETELTPQERKIKSRSRLRALSGVWLHRKKRRQELKLKPRRSKKEQSTPNIIEINPDLSKNHEIEKSETISKPSSPKSSQRREVKSSQIERSGDLWKWSGSGPSTSLQASFVTIDPQEADQGSVEIDSHSIPRKRKRLKSLILNRGNRILKKFASRKAKQKKTESQTTTVLDDRNLLEQELREEINKREKLAAKKAEQYGPVPILHRVIGKLLPTRSFGNLSPTFIALAQKTGDPDIKKRLKPADGLDSAYYIRGRDDVDYGRILLVSLLFIAFFIFLLLVGFGLGLALTQPAVGLAIDSDSVMIPTPIQLSLNESRSTQSDGNLHQKHPVGHQEQSRYMDKDQSFSIGRSWHSHGSTTYSDIQEDTTLTFTVVLNLTVLFQVSNSARFPTTVERLTVGLAWLKPLTTGHQGLPKTECINAPDKSIITGESHWDNHSLPFIVRSVSSQTMSTYPLGTFFDPVSLFEDIAFDTEEDDVTIPEGNG